MSEATICKDGHWIHTECRAYEAGRADAEARIIKLLEAESKCKLPEHDYNGDCYCDTIALIKEKAE